MRGDHAALVDTAYSAGALADPILSEDDKGAITVAWPRGRGTLAACVMSAELVEQWAAQTTELRARIAAALDLHAVCHVGDEAALACSRGTYPGGGLVVHSPVCLRDAEAWPCDTARALGVES